MDKTELPSPYDIRRLLQNGTVAQLEALLREFPDLLHKPVEGGTTFRGIISTIVRFGDLERLQLALKLGAGPANEGDLLADCITSYVRHNDCFDTVLALLFPDGVPFPDDAKSCSHFIKYTLPSVFNYNYGALIKSLIKSGMDIQKIEVLGQRSTIYAAISAGGKMAMFQTLIKHGASVNELKDDYGSPLEYAIRRESPAAPLLFKAGAKPGIAEDKFMLIASECEVEAGLLAELFPNDTYEVFKDSDGRTAAHHACSYANKEMFDLLVAKKFPLDLADDKGYTPLHCAVVEKNKIFVNKLLALKVDINAVLENGETAVDLAPNVTLRKKLISAGGKSGSELAGHDPITTIKSMLDADEPWTVYLVKRLECVDESAIQHWLDLLQLGVAQSSTKPTKTWIKKSNALIDSIGIEQYNNIVCATFEVTKEKRTSPEWDEESDDDGYFDSDYSLSDDSTSLLKTLAWGCARSNDADTCRGLRNLAAVMYKKVYYVGMRNAKVANAAMLALSLMDDDAGIKDIIALRSVTKYNPALTHIERLFVKLAQERGMGTDELAESAIPDYGLSDIGTYHHAFNNMFSVIVTIPAVGKTELQWHKGDKTQKTMPAEVKLEYSDDVKRVKALAKDLQQASRAHSQRIEQLYISGKSFPFAKWREQYLDHRLIGVLARRLIWRFKVGSRTIDAHYLNGELCDINAAPLENLDSAHVTLWHPIIADADTIKNWRCVIVDNEITQPFKQAHREIYRVTDAEKNTSTYSARFSNQVLIHTQFNALATARKWQQTRGGSWDGGQENSAYKTVGNISVEFVAEGSDDYGHTDSGIYRGVVTGAMRFYRNNKPVKLENIDALIFTELMRDVDLFVGVSNIGNVADPQDYANQHQRWNQSSFGELNASALTRRDVLESLIKRMKIAEKLHIEGRYLHVQGTIRNYKIHLGSTNIMMEPDDSYLCIVPSRSRSKDNIRLPFEGDAALSQIISKAILLANDNKIKDSSITSQIGGDSRAAGN